MWLKTVVEDKKEVKRVLSQVRAIPITVSYDIVVILKSEIDVFKCSQSLMNSLWLYKFMYFEYNYMHIDAFMSIPDSNNIEIQREKDLKGDNPIKMTNHLVLYGLIL